MDKIILDNSVAPVYLVPLTSEEEAEREQWAIEEAMRQESKQTKEAAKESARDKLAALGLTENEIAAIVGM